MNRELDPEAKEAATAVKRALLELQFYARSHTTHPEAGEGIHTLISAGALWGETSAFIASHAARFYGFNLAVTEHSVPVLEVVVVGRTDPVRCVGFADGHVERVPLERRLHQP